MQKKNEVPSTHFPVYRQFEKKKIYTYIKFNSWNRISAASSNLAPFFSIPQLLIKNPPKKQMIMEKRIKKGPEIYTYEMHTYEKIIINWHSSKESFR